METLIRTGRRLCFRAFEFDPKTHELLKHGREVGVRGHPAAVLAALLETPGEVVTRQELRKRLWHEGTFVDFEHILNNSVNKLREALGDEAATPRFIQTVPRLGYRFIAPVELQDRQMSTPLRQEQELPEELKHAARSYQSPYSISQLGRYTWWLMLAAIALAIVLFEVASAGVSP